MQPLLCSEEIKNLQRYIGLYVLVKDVVIHNFRFTYISSRYQEILGSDLKFAVHV